MSSILTDINKTIEHNDHYLWFISDFIPTICNEYYEDYTFVTAAHTDVRLLKNIPERFNGVVVNKQSVADWLIDHEYIKIVCIGWFVFTKKFYEEFYKYADSFRPIRNNLTKQLSKSINEKILSEMYESDLKIMKTDDHDHHDDHYKYTIDNYNLE